MMMHNSTVKDNYGKVLILSKNASDKLEYKGGQRFTNFYLIHKVCNMAQYFSKILELTACRIIKMDKKVYMSVKNMPNKVHLTDANFVWGQYNTI